MNGKRVYAKSKVNDRMTDIRLTRGGRVRGLKGERSYAKAKVISR